MWRFGGSKLMGGKVVWRDPTQPFDMNKLAFGDFASITSTSSTSFQINQAAGGYMVISGTGFAFDSNGFL